MTVFLTQNFTDTELACPCCQKCAMNLFFLRALQHVRTQCERPFVINSGFRCEKHNKSIKGAAVHSRHRYGMAADIAIEGWTAQQLHKFLFEATRYQEHNCFTGIGIYPTHFHFELRYDHNAVWVKG